MATERQLKTLEKARRARKRKAKGLMGGFAMPKTADIMDGFKKAGLMVIGFVGGREVSRMVFKNDETGFKRYLGSILQLGGGVMLVTQKNETLRYIGYGLAGSGAIEAVSKVLNKDILAEGVLSGISLGSLFGGKAIPAYDARNVQLPADYVPNLPPLPADPIEDDFEGVSDVEDVEMV